MSAQHKRINLIVREGFEYTPTGRVLHWLLTAGRTIVIVTELVVIVAFLSRFWLDRMLTDLSTQNNAKRLQIEASQSFESEFKSAQERLVLIKTIQAANIKPSEITQVVTSLLPIGVSLTDLNVNEENKVDIRGISISETGVAGLIVGLNTSKIFKNVVLGDVNLDTRGAQVIKFSIKAELVKTGQ